MKQKFTSYTLLALLVMSQASCSENYSNGERVGLVTQFSHKGLVWKSWEGNLNLTQTGMNSSGSEPFKFSLDNDKEDSTVRKKIDSAANLGWKVKLVYHETFGKNWFSNRGSTDHFITDCIVLDKNPVADLFKNKDSATQGKVRDTVYLVIYRDKK
jgi:hypothetical protein